MVIAMISMGMMQMSFHKIIKMIPMGNLFMSAGISMDMSLVVGATAMTRSAGSWILRSDLQAAFIHVVFVNFMHMTVVEIVCVISMLDGCMTASFGMDVIVVGMCFVFHSVYLSFFSSAWCSPLRTRRRICSSERE
jgi:hypothetical protein